MDLLFSRSLISTLPLEDRVYQYFRHRSHHELDLVLILPIQIFLTKLYRHSCPIYFLDVLVYIPLLSNSK